MAVKVISRVSDKFEEFRCDCGACGATLVVSEFSDLKIARFGRARDEDGELMVYVTCPDCKSNVLSPEPQQRLYTHRLKVLKYK